MKPTMDLREEHGPVKLMLKVLESMADKMEKGEKVNVADMESALVFLREFADKCHHGKEEALLFPAMCKNGIEEEIALIDALMQEHVRGRNYVGKMAKAVEEKDLAKFAENAKAYAVLLNAHIDRENQILFPMADKSLSEQSQNELEKGFEDLERNVIGEGRHEKLHAIVGKLKESYLV